MSEEKQKATVTFEQDGEKAIITITATADKKADIVWKWDPPLTPNTIEKLMHYLAIDYVAMLQGAK